MQPTQLSPAGFHLVENEEGYRPWVYDDKDGKPICKGKIVRGKPTFGIGHLIRPGEKFPIYPAEATRESVIELFNKDSVWVYELLKLVKVPLNQNQFDALFLLVFNIGGGRLEYNQRNQHGFVPGFRNSTLLMVLNQGKYQLAADHFLDWKFSDGKPILLPRRKRERELFLKPVVTIDVTPEKQKAPPKPEAPKVEAKKPATSSQKPLGPSKPLQPGSRRRPSK